MHIIIFLLAFSCGLLPSGIGRSETNSTPPPVLLRLGNQRVEAARKTYEVWWDNYREHRTSEELLYRWSLRWLDAEKELHSADKDLIPAFQAHWERMKELDKLIKNLQRAKQTTIDEVSAAEYYRVEAEIWLLQAKEEKKNK